MYDQSDYEEIKSLLKSRLSKKRYTHSVNVAQQAKILAKINNFDEEKSYFAGLIHDVCKEIPLTEQETYVLSSSMDIDEVEKKSQPLWHAIAGAEFVREHYRINDKDILNSIRYHTVARAGMSILEKIIYLADLTSADRSYKDVAQTRKICEKNLDEGMLYALKFSITDSVSKSNTIPQSTFEAYNSYILMTKLLEDIYDRK